MGKDKRAKVSVDELWELDVLVKCFVSAKEALSRVGGEVVIYDNPEVGIIVSASAPTMSEVERRYLSREDADIFIRRLTRGKYSVEDLAEDTVIKLTGVK